MGDKDTVVVTYTLGPRHVMFDEWGPKELYQVGAYVELAVEPSVYNGRVTFRINNEEEF